jgi:hypothetical protein
MRFRYETSEGLVLLPMGITMYMRLRMGIHVLRRSLDSVKMVVLFVELSVSPIPLFR